MKRCLPYILTLALLTACVYFFIVRPETGLLKALTKHRYLFGLPYVLLGLAGLLGMCFRRETAALLAARGALPPVLTGSAVVGSERSAELFDAAYAEHSRRVADVLAKPERS